MGSRNSTGGGARPRVSPEQQAANRQRFSTNITTTEDMMGPSRQAQRTGSPSFLNTRAKTQPQNMFPALRAAPDPYMSALDIRPGVNYDTGMQQRLSAQSQGASAPVNSSFVDALDRQQGVSYNTDMQKRMANASAVSQGLPAPFPGY